MARGMLLALTVVAACGGSGASPGTSSPPARPATTAVGTTGFVVAVIDGDSLEIDLGAGAEHIRLAGINAPEAGECWADEARDALAGFAGGAVTVAVEGRDQFGRLLGRVFAGPTEVDIEMVRSGHAIALSGGPEADRLIAAEEEAVAASSGLWSATACGPAGAGDLDLREVVSDAPGPDDQNPDGEYIVIGNAGTTADLTGWSLRDESSTHRYAFPRGFELDAGETVIIRSGCGDDTPTELHWCADGPVWNNGGDMALLLDPAGNVAARLRYWRPADAIRFASTEGPVPSSGR